MRLEKHVIQQYYKRLKYLVTMNTKVFIESYEAPQVEIIEVAVEKGFGVSGGITTEDLGDDIEW